MIGRQMQYRADQHTEALINRPHGFVDHGRHGGRGLRKLVDHQPEMPARAIAPAHSLQHREYQLAKGLLWRRRASDRHLNDAVP